MNLFFISCFFCVFNIFSTEINEFSFMLKPSTIEGAGVGVFAAHDIEMGTIIDGSHFPIRILHKSEIPSDFLQYCVACENGLYKCPDSFWKMAIFWYLNHSSSPNLDWIGRGICKVKKYIKKGEELLMDYNQLDEPEEAKEDYYKA